MYLISSLCVNVFAFLERERSLKQDEKERDNKQEVKQGIYQISMFLFLGFTQPSTLCVSLYMSLYLFVLGYGVEKFFFSKPFQSPPHSRSFIDTQQV